MNLDQVIELIESKHTADEADRHAQSIEQLCSEMNNEASKCGFLICELDKVTQVLRLLLNGLHNDKFELVPALVSLLEVLNLPFERRKNKSKDVTFIEELLPDLLNALCDLILYDVPVESDPEG